MSAGFSDGIKALPALLRSSLAVRYTVRRQIRIQTGVRNTGTSKQMAMDIVWDALKLVHLA
jgi:hypothetical protein